MSRASSTAEQVRRPVLIDPRLRERRIEVARDQGRKRLRRAAIVGTLVLLVVLGGLLTQSPLLDVDRVEVSGADHLPAGMVVDASGIALGSPLLGLDLDGAEARIEALPWVASASVGRSWAGTVTVAITERTPVARIGRGDAAVLVDAEGRALGAAIADDQLPQIGGSAIAPGARLDERRATAAAVLGGLPAALLAEVAEAGAGPSGVRLELVDGIEVTWGDDSDRSAKADNLGTLLEQADRATIASIDVTVPGSPAVTRKNVPQ